MATNKHAIIRYHALDRCFSNFARKFFIEDLVEACNRDLYEFAGVEDGVKKRQVYADIAFMESDQGWSVPLDRIAEGRRTYYRYSDSKFSIKNIGLTPTQAIHLKDTLLMLSRFKGMQQLEWIEEMKIRLENSLHLKENVPPIVGYEYNPYLERLEYFGGLFEAIRNEVVLCITYKAFNQEHPVNMYIHPWYLKQYNSRWFLFGLDEETQEIKNLPIDRIIDFQSTTRPYKKNTEVDFESYFDDVVGVTVRNDAEVERVLLKLDQRIWPYIRTKPIHGSQKILERGKDQVVIELKVQINYELEALLFSHMDAVEVLEPVHLRQKFKHTAEKILAKYR